MGVIEPNKVDTKTVRRFIGFIEEFRKLNPEIQAQQISLFLHVVAVPDLTVKELAQRAGVTLGGSISRNLDALSERRRVMKAGEVSYVSGHGLIEVYEDAFDRRFKRARPTAKGRRVYNSLVQLLDT